MLANSNMQMVIGYQFINNDVNAVCSHAFAV